ncbi:DUF305 domain-containing protein [Nocardioides ferulae]|uniref:DUF305 domain-containing protein n=1 Tax=Nocardioides ferulae TaxID=2340821 RepID=UPI001F0BC668|nr:DUF305 domain-containing protein [Nocardioides ferulae]
MNDRNDNHDPTDGNDAQEAHGGHHDDSSHERRMYLRFAAMITTSTVVMFVLTYTNAYSADHVRFSLERVYMALLMGGAMALVMLSFMVSMMYRNRTLNAVVIVAALVVGGAALYASRAQALVNDSTYMRAMIPHHSIAILTSERADIDDVRVRKLADEIIKAQRREIDEMDWLIDDIAENGPATTQEEADARPVPDFEATAAPLPRPRDGVGDRAPVRELAAAGATTGPIAWWWRALSDQ